MDGVFHHGVPSAVAGAAILLWFQYAVVHAPAHSIEEQRRAREFLAAVVAGRHQRRIPETVLALAGQQSLTHQNEVALQTLIVFLRLFRELWHGLQVFHHLHQSGINPARTAAPVAVLPVLFLIGRHVVGIAPPQALLRIEQSAGQRVAAPGVHPHGMVYVFLLARDAVHLRIDGHGHLYGINPGPPAVERAVGLAVVAGLHLVCQVLLHVHNHLLLTGHHVAVKVSLLAALVVGVARGDAVACRPLVEVGPTVGIIEVALLGIHLVELHQSLVIDGARPQTAGTYSPHVGGNGRVTILCHEVVVGFLCHAEHFLCCLCLHVHEGKEGSNNSR